MENNTMYMQGVNDAKFELAMRLLTEVFDSSNSNQVDAMKTTIAKKTGIETSSLFGLPATKVDFRGMELSVDDIDIVVKTVRELGAYYWVTTFKEIEEIIDTYEKYRKYRETECVKKVMLPYYTELCKLAGLKGKPISLLHDAYQSEFDKQKYDTDSTLSGAHCDRVLLTDKGELLLGSEYSSHLEIISLEHLLLIIKYEEAYDFGNMLVKYADSDDEPEEKSKFEYWDKERAKYKKLRDNCKDKPKEVDIDYRKLNRYQEFPDIDWITLEDYHNKNK